MKFLHLLNPPLRQERLIPLSEVAEIYVEEVEETGEENSTDVFFHLNHGVIYRVNLEKEEYKQFLEYLDDDKKIFNIVFFSEIK